jgi:tetratricopeptide (TPR) repeat protein
MEARVRFRRIWYRQLVLYCLVLIWPAAALALTGQVAPDFSLKQLDGTAHELSSLGDTPMVMLYFFDPESKPSRDGLLTLDRLCAKYEHSDLVVWAVTRSSAATVKRFASHFPVSFPILLDSGAVSRIYRADQILPTTCIIGPELKVLDLLHGGGKSVEVMLVRLAQRSLQQRKSEFAHAVSEKVIQSNPENVKARVVKAYAALSQGRVEQSESEFAQLAQKSGQARIAGTEGLSAVAAKKGQNQKALELARQVEQADPKRGYVHVIKADVLYSQNKKQAAEREYQKAVAKADTEPYHRAKAYNQLGRIRAEQGDWEQSKSLYDQAVKIDPYYIEATSNKGLVYEKEGRFDQALASYAKALRIDQQDAYALMLQQNLQQMLRIEQNKTEKQRIDTLVKDLVARYRSGKGQAADAPRDDWTSRPMVLSFVDFRETGGLAVRDGFATILASQLADSLNASGRVQVVERAIVEKLLQELNLGASDIADPATALELGKVLSAKLIGTGSLLYVNESYFLTLRLIDTETTRIAKVFSMPISIYASVQKDLHRLNRKILAAIIDQYPLQGYVVKAESDQVMVNLGAAQGVVPGTTFEIVEPAAPIVYRGRRLQAQPKVIGTVEVLDVQSDHCTGRVHDAQRTIKRDDQLREKFIDDIRQLSPSGVTIRG